MGITRIKEDTDMALLGRRLNLLPLGLATPLPLPPTLSFFHNSHAKAASSCDTVRDTGLKGVGRFRNSARSVCNYAGTNLSAALCSPNRKS